MTFLRVSFLATSLVAVAASFASAQTLTDLGDLGGGESIAWGVNDSCEVTGTSNEPGNLINTAFIYTDGSMTALDDEVSDAYAINNSGEVVGDAPDSSGLRDAAFYSGGTTTLLPGGMGNASAINNSGEIVGTNAQYGAFSYANGTMTSLGLGSSVAPLGLNNSGQIVGVYSNPTDGFPHAFLDTNGLITDLGTLGGRGDSRANAINDSGLVVGEATSNGGDYHAFLYANGSMTDLGTMGDLASDALAVNNSGEVVGWLGQGGPDDAFVYTSGSGMQDLNDIYSSLLVGEIPGEQGFLSLYEATGVNDAGQIVGEGLYWNGTQESDQAFLLTPAPEPSTVAFLGAGALMMISLGALRSHAAGIIARC